MRIDLFSMACKMQYEHQFIQLFIHARNPTFIFILFYFFLSGERGPWIFEGGGPRHIFGNFTICKFKKALCVIYCRISSTILTVLEYHPLLILVCRILYAVSRSQRCKFAQSSKYLYYLNVNLI